MRKVTVKVTFELYIVLDDDTSIGDVMDDLTEALPDRFIDGATIEDVKRLDAKVTDSR